MVGWNGRSISLGVIEIEYGGVQVRKAEDKIKRMQAALTHKEADRVAVGDFFWTGFSLKCLEKWGNDFDIHRYFDLDYIVITPNMDPHIKPFEILSQKGEDIIIKTGFEATVRRSGTAPMPHFEEFSVKQPEDMAKFMFDEAADKRRFYEGGG